MPNMCIGDAGYSSGESIRAGAVAQAANIRRAAALAIALANAEQMVSNYRAQDRIARRTMDIAERQQAQVENVFWPRDAQFLAEFANPEAIEEIEVMARRYAGRLVAPIAAAFAQRQRELQCGMSRYCTSANRKALQDLLMARAGALANARALGRDIAFAEYQARTDTNYERRLQAVALGRGLLNQAVSLYESAGRSLASAGNYITNQFNNALSAFGYAQNEYRTATQEVDRLQRPAWQGQPARMPRPGTNSLNWPTPNQGAFSASSQGDMSFDSTSNMQGDASGLSRTSESQSPWNGQQGEKWNEGDIGNRDLIRTGVMTYPVIGLSAGVVVVKMSDFLLGYADHLTEGDTTF